MWNLNKISRRVQEHDSIDLADMIVFYMTITLAGRGGLHITTIYSFSSANHKGLIRFFHKENSSAESFFSS